MYAVLIQNKSESKFSKMLISTFKVPVGVIFKLELDKEQSYEQCIATTLKT